MSNQPENGAYINLQDLSLEQLNQLIQSTQQEIIQFSNNYKQLKLAEGYFKRSKHALNCMKPENKDNEVFIPLTQSVYVPGKIDDIDNVLVGVGTGYFVQKDIQGASEFFDRKIESVRKNEKTIDDIIDRDRRQLEKIIGYRNLLLKTAAEAQEKLKEQSTKH